MAAHRKGMNLLRIVIEVLALLLVVVLTANQKLQFSLLLFALGAITSLFAGRLFCGWIFNMLTSTPERARKASLLASRPVRTLDV